MFPGHYHFSPFARIESLVEMTEWLIKCYSPYRVAYDYFGHYSVIGRATEHLGVATQIITAQDNRIVPVVDFYGLAPSPRLTIDPTHAVVTWATSMCSQFGIESVN